MVPGRRRMSPLRPGGSPQPPPAPSSRDRGVIHFRGGSLRGFGSRRPWLVCVREPNLFGVEGTHQELAFSAGVIEFVEPDCRIPGDDSGAFVAVNNNDL